MLIQVNAPQDTNLFCRMNEHQERHPLSHFNNGLIALVFLEYYVGLDLCAIPHPDGWPYGGKYFRLSGLCRLYRQDIGAVIVLEFEGMQAYNVKMQLQRNNPTHTMENIDVLLAGVQHGRPVREDVRWQCKYDFVSTARSLLIHAPHAPETKLCTYDGALRLTPGEQPALVLADRTVSGIDDIMHYAR